MQVTTYYLEMTEPAALRPVRARRHDFEIRRAEIPSPELNRFLYTAVGGDWYWTDRLPWTYRQWLAYLNRPELQTWVGYLAGTPAGYCELESQSRGDVEIAYFGLLPSFVGQGLGGALLTAAVEKAWAMKAARVWLHTCTLDHPTALHNYERRGFRIFREEVTVKELPGSSPGPWPGSGEHP
ncbi:MAG TPA: GNAT family N-acetyltransferase [Gemmataceae bacterium]|nr:GNAT family N-acetyltransferase [Gemmataceae bacterium]